MVVPDSCSRDCRGEALAAPCAPAAARGARAMQACNQVSGPRSTPIGCTLPMCGRGFKPMAVPNYPLFVRSSSAKTVSANEPVPAGHPAVPSHTRLPSAPPFFDHPSSNLALALALDLDLTNTRRGSHCNRCTRPQRPASIQIPTTTTPLFTTVALALSASPSRRFWPQHTRRPHHQPTPLSTAAPVKDTSSPLHQTTTTTNDSVDAIFFIRACILLFNPHVREVSPVQFLSLSGPRCSGAEHLAPGQPWTANALRCTQSCLHVNNVKCTY